MHNSYLIVNLFYTIKSRVHTFWMLKLVEDFSPSSQACSWPFSPFFSSISALVSLVRTLVIGCPLYLGA